jgi:tetrahydromethanopterin S-methyltransferase subunit G
VIDTLKLARRLEGAGMERRQAEALAEGVADGLRDDLGRHFAQIDSRFDKIEKRLERVEAELAELKGDMKLLRWMVGASIALTTGVLLKLLVS